MLSLSLALALMIKTGLPQRAESSGYRLGVGQLVAPELGSLAPPFELPTLDYRTRSLAEFRGKPLIISFFATWCPPCVDELRELRALAESESGRARVVAVNLGELPEAVRAFTQPLSLSFAVLLDQNLEVASRYQVRGLPTAFLLDDSGRVRRVYHGTVRGELLLQDLAGLGPPQDSEPA